MGSGPPAGWACRGVSGPWWGHPMIWEILRWYLICEVVVLILLLRFIYVRIDDNKGN